MTTPTTLYTVQDFWKFIEQPENQHRKFEFIDGVIVEKSGLTVHTGILKSRINGEVAKFLHITGSGELAVSVDHYSQEDSFNTRRPEISYFSNENAKLLDDDDYASIMPDLAIEVKSPNNTYKELREKAEYYLRHGSRTVWNFLPEKGQVQVYTLVENTLQVETLGKTELLTGGDVLPGFTLPLAQVFKDKGQ